MRNEEAKENLKNIFKDLNRGSVLVFGPEGIGKFTLVKELISNYPEFEKIIIENEDNFLKISTSRMLVSLSKYKVNWKRVILINDAHKFQKEAQNTLLKTLEEPLSNTLFILITHKPNKILPTIRSRSILVKFYPFSEEETFKILQEKKFNLNDINFVLKIYPNQPGKAIKLLENEEKLELLKKFFQSIPLQRLALVEEIKKIFSLQEFLEIYLSFEKEKFYKERKILKLKEILNLYFDADYYLNEDLQLNNLILNYG